MDKYIIIPKKILQSNLNPTEKLVYGFIYSMSQKKGYCYAKNYFFKDELKMSLRTIQRSIENLEDKKFITRDLTKHLRKLVPLIDVNMSKTSSKSVKNNTQNNDKIDTHNRITNNKKNNKLINSSIDSSLSSSENEKLENLLIKCIEHLNKRYLGVSDYKVKPYEYKYIGILIKLFKSYLNSSFDTIDFDSDEYYKYLYCFYLDLRSYIHKHNDSSLRKRYYPYRFNDIDKNLKNFSFDNSKFKKEDYLNFKNELDDNDDFDPDENSAMNWFK